MKAQSRYSASRAAHRPSSSASVLFAVCASAVAVCGMGPNGHTWFVAAAEASLCSSPDGSALCGVAGEPSYLQHLSAKVPRLHVMGRTGDGKSSFSNALAKRLGFEGDVAFAESSDAKSHTHEPQEVVVGSFSIIDNPGLLDTTGVERDEQNLLKIVDVARRAEYLNGLVIVVNEQAPRFDSGMQDAMKLLIDSFGPKIYNNMRFVFTRAYGMVTAVKAGATAAKLSKMIAERVGLPSDLPPLPFTQIDTRPRDLHVMGLSPERIESAAKATEAALDEVARWVKSKPAYPTDSIKAAEYEQRRIAREAEERAEFERQQAAVVRTETENREIEASRRTVPLYRDEQKCSDQNPKEIVPELAATGAAVGGVVGFLGGVLLSGLFSGGGPVCWTEKRHYADQTIVTYETQHREVQVLGSGKKVFGEWVKVSNREASL